MKTMSRSIALGVACAVLVAIVVALTWPTGQALAEEQVSVIQVTFSNDLEVTADDLDVFFNHEMCGFAWTGQGVQLPYHSGLPTSTLTHHGAEVAPGHGTQYRYGALLPEGENLDVEAAFWTLDGEIVGQADPLVE